MRFAVVAHRATETNRGLVDVVLPGTESLLLTPAEALTALRPGDVALARLDIRPGLDGIERGLRKLHRLAAGGVHVLNPPPALLASHDKLITAAKLRRAGVPHPHTAYVTPGGSAPPFAAPVVVKPRYGSWGRDIFLCESRRELGRCLRSLHDRQWFRQHGALVQELVPPQGHDLRVIVGADEVVGAIKRVAAPDEWRTNLSLGGRRQRVRPPAAARALAVAAAGAVGGDLVGVDLLPDGRGGYSVLEVNAAVDFTREYSLDGDVFTLAVCSLRPGWLDGTAAAAL